MHPINMPIEDDYISGILKYTNNNIVTLPKPYEPEKLSSSWIRSDVIANHRLIKKDITMSIVTLVNKEPIYSNFLVDLGTQRSSKKFEIISLYN